MAHNSLCSIIDCGKPARTRGMCSTHYNQWLETPDAMAIKGPANGTLSAWLLANVEWNGAGCLLWPFSRNPNGYACQVRMDGQVAYAHHHMCRLAEGEPPSPDHEVAHSCGNGRNGCVDPRHVRWATRLENMDDMIGHGRTNRGTKCPTSQLTDDQVRDIRRLSGTMSQKRIAALFSTSQGNVCNIILRKRWAWLE